MKANKKAWLLIALGLSILLVGATLASLNQPESYSPYLSKSPSPTGTKAFYEFTSHEHNVGRWSAPPTRLPDRSEKVALFMVGPYYTLSTEEQRHYQQWMEQGNTVVLLKQNPTGLFDIKTEPLPSANESAKTLVDGYEAVVEQSFRLMPDTDDDVLLEDSQGALVLERTYGEGRLIVSMNPNWVQNGTILEEDHALLMNELLMAAGAEQVLWDEYIHGQENIPTAFTIYPKWILVVTLQLLLLTILWLWYKGKRFGPIYTPREHTVRLGDERLQALSAWYMRGGFYDESIRIQEEFLRSLIQNRYGIRQHQSWGDILEALAPYQSKEQQERWEAYTKGLDHRKSIRKTEYLQWSKKLDDLRKEVQQP